jgi:hypothetical protein
MLSLHKIWVRLINRRFLEQITLPQVAGIKPQRFFSRQFRNPEKLRLGNKFRILKLFVQDGIPDLNVPVVVATTVPEVLNYWIYMIRHLDRAAQFLAVIHV